MSPDRRRTAIEDADWRKQAPRWVLVTSATVMFAAFMRYELLWRSRVEAHLVVAEDPKGGGYSRLAAVETLTGITREEVKLLREEVREHRRDQLQQARWAAERVGDVTRTKQIDARLQTMKPTEAAKE